MMQKKLFRFIQLELKEQPFPYIVDPQSDCHIHIVFSNGISIEFAIGLSVVRAGGQRPSSRRFVQVSLQSSLIGKVVRLALSAKQAVDRLHFVP